MRTGRGATRCGHQPIGFTLHLYIYIYIWPIWRMATHELKIHIYMKKLYKSDGRESRAYIMPRQSSKIIDLLLTFTDIYFVGIMHGLWQHIQRINDVLLMVRAVSSINFTRIIVTCTETQLFCSILIYTHLSYLFILFTADRQSFLTRIAIGMLC